MRLAIALFAIFILFGCSPKDITGNAVLKDNLIEVTDISMGPEGYLGSDFLIKGHLIIKTGQLSNDITIKIIINAQ